jgi:hypothetical protein
VGVSVTLNLPGGTSLRLSADQARSLAARLWEIAAYDGAVPLATAIREALGSADLVIPPIDLSSREHAALLRCWATD